MVGVDAVDDRVRRGVEGGVAHALAHLVVPLHVRLDLLDEGVVLPRRGRLEGGEPLVRVDLAALSLVGGVGLVGAHLAQALPVIVLALALALRPRLLLGQDVLRAALPLLHVLGLFVALVLVNDLALVERGSLLALLGQGQHLFLPLLHAEEEGELGWGRGRGD